MKHPLPRRLTVSVTRTVAATTLVFVLGLAIAGCGSESEGNGELKRQDLSLINKEQNANSGCTTTC